jgi:hypothetical protein
VDLAAHAGLRLGDLLNCHGRMSAPTRLPPSCGPARAGGAARLIIPIYDALKRVLDAIAKRSTAILTNSLHGPWTENSFGTA